uniref:Protein kinase domain-containing protein n=1 Tax=Phaeomonas parva TaxID=124430 RepID=A0A7S1XRI3_9STRA|mmetsp:Transcript_3227/g.9365  ORF Transcript_3227/g.9365 Transcript_3227/m.9365 type:complete len:452 (+) Transcript_3227:56-1411(+)
MTLTPNALAPPAPPTLQVYDAQDHLVQLENEGRALGRLKGCRGILQMLEHPTTAPRFWRELPLGLGGGGGIGSGCLSPSAAANGPAADVILLQFCEHKDLFSLLDPKSSRAKPFPERIVKRFARQLLDALSVCHARGVAHRDIKLENILIDASGHLQLADFGLSHVRESCSTQSKAFTLRRASSLSLCESDSASDSDDDAVQSLDRDVGELSFDEAPDAAAAFGRGRQGPADEKLLCTGHVGTVSYMAPEIIASKHAQERARAEGYDAPPPAVYDACKADVWSLACVLFAAKLGRPPFDNALPSKGNWYYNRIYNSHRRGAAREKKGEDAASGPCSERNKFWFAHRNAFASAMAESSAEEAKDADAAPASGEPDEPSEGFRSFCDAIFQHAPSKRPGPSELLRHPWLSGDDIADEAEALNAIRDRLRAEQPKASEGAAGAQERKLGTEAGR